jgi:hypothetical protein
MGGMGDLAGDGMGGLSYPRNKIVAQIYKENQTQTYLKIEIHIVELVFSKNFFHLLTRFLHIMEQISFLRLSFLVLF